MANIGQFYGVGKNKAKRRKNRPDGSPRKVYAYTRKEQKGTPMERFIDTNYDSLDEQRNATNPVPGRMSQSESTGNLSALWGGLNRKGTGGKAIRDYVAKHGGTAGQARDVLIGRSEISFGADPRSR